MPKHGTEFHITDETPISDPFEFLEPFLECRDMRVTKTSYSYLPLWILVYLFFLLKRLANQMGLSSFIGDGSRGGSGRRDCNRSLRTMAGDCSSDEPLQQSAFQKRWWNYVTPTTLTFMCNSHFLNRTKASLRLDYEPLVDFEQAMRSSIEWYKTHLKL